MISSEREKFSWRTWWPGSKVLSNQTNCNKGLLPKEVFFHQNTKYPQQTKPKRLIIVSVKILIQVDSDSNLISVRDILLRKKITIQSGPDFLLVKKDEILYWHKTLFF